MPVAATRMDLEIIILSEVSQTEKDKYHMIALIQYVESKKKKKELIYKTGIDPPTQKTNLWLPKGKGVRRDKLGLRD